MTTNSMIFALVFSSLSLFATATHAQDAASPQRGVVAVDARAPKAIVAGPVAIHAYTAFSGAAIFVVAAVTGTDRDCASGASARAALVADRMHTVSVGAGQIACVATTSARGSELLWHAQKSEVAPTLLASR